MISKARLLPFIFNTGIVCLDKLEALAVKSLLATGGWRDQVFRAVRSKLASRPNIMSPPTLSAKPSELNFSVAYATCKNTNLLIRTDFDLQARRGLSTDHGCQCSADEHPR